MDNQYNRKYSQKKYLLLCNPYNSLIVYFLSDSLSIYSFYSVKFIYIVPVRTNPHFPPSPHQQKKTISTKNIETVSIMYPLPAIPHPSIPPSAHNNPRLQQPKARDRRLSLPPLPIPDLPIRILISPSSTEKGAPFYRSALYSPDFHPLNYFLISRTSANAWIAVLA